MYCQQCGTPNRDEAPFCRQCGAALPKSGELEPPAPPTSHLEAPTVYLPADPNASARHLPPPTPHQPEPPPDQGYQSPLRNQQASPGAPGYTTYLSQTESARDPHAPPSSYATYSNYQPPLPPGAGGRAVAAMILGILGLVAFGPLTGVPAIILGKLEMNAIRAGRAAAGGLTVARIGFYTGIVSTALTCLFFGGLLSALLLGAWR